MTPALSILALVTDAFGGRGGIAQFNRDFLRALADVGAVTSTLVLPRHTIDAVAALPSNIRQLPPHPSRIGYSVAALWTALRQRVDIVFCGHAYMMPLALLIARLTRAKLIVIVHGIEGWSRPSWLCQRAIEAADMVLCASRYTRNRILRWAAISPERLVIMPATVEEAFTPGDGSALRESWNLGGKRVLLTVARLDARERYKGHDRVIEAIPELVHRGYDIAYLVVGEGDDQPRLLALANKLGVDGRVYFIGGIERKALITVYQMADLFVMPSTGEGFGIAFLEAMASGTPAIGLAVAGACDALADGELGILVAEDGLTAAIERALSNPARDPKALASATRDRFGRKAFSARVRMVINRLLETA